ncbi:Flp family type IVb pilin [Pectobacterium odoriferum]|uniref:Pilus assembly protein PilA n=1 Tax=Pectobacterium odoriferum TaxID=78398 RepID=A0ABD6VVV7_9GAMM|nr:Flp family type IVb pilin [Pectobacterium odoriferum]AIU86944.1 pilus assembly protein PilA [Pectobacterium odoriferum]KGA32982.1 pilus assembly protein PilA [Pectobacterium odoriferum]KGA41344.1 pilus assembly protein PilA [Pectobacterium odoriferum]MBA0188858.1 Flp family type IVb pilin [Pectobacterium odoriferum]MCA6961234.1 Flp family type IVb pilin [Pectobacterium odoriferum]
MNQLTTKYFIAAQLSMEKFFKDNRGVATIEYALIAVAMATLLAFALGNQNSGFLGSLRETFDKITAAIKQVTIAPAS